MRHQDPASKLWNYGAVQSVTGGVILPDDNATVSNMLAYAGGQSGYGTMGISPGCTVGAAELRRDGFAAMVAGDSIGTLVSRPLTWSASKKAMFVNCDGSLTVELVRSTAAGIYYSVQQRCCTNVSRCVPRSLSVSLWLCLSRSLCLSRL
jgi:hypothetical protein